MAKKHKYYFNPHDLMYVLHRPKNWEQVLKAGGILACTFLVILIGYGTTIYKAKNPDQKKLRQQVNFYKRQLDQMNRKVEKMNGTLSELEQRDNQLYRVIFEADPMPSTVTAAGTGGVEKYKNIEPMDGSEAIIATEKKFDFLSAKLNVMSQSYDQLMKLAKNKQKMLASMPAIQPISNKTLKQMSSGFGYRLHPIYKQMQLHPGMDFTAATGTPVYATGDGVIEGRDPNGSGYGNHIIISHGFGYRTLYGHLSKILVRPGQKVKRGEKIGLVGSTGLSTAPHLHYEVIKEGRKINPVNYFHNDLNSSEYSQLIEMANRSNQSFD